MHQTPILLDFLSGKICAVAAAGTLWNENLLPTSRCHCTCSMQVILCFCREAVGTKRTPPLVRVRLSVEYRVHSRQMLCVGGSAIPFGWSFLSIAKVPMCWQPTDLWEVDVELPAGSRVEYKYVILEAQDWTKQVDDAAEGRVEYTYRVAPETNPPDVQRITRQMAIVAWQAGPNRILQVPTEAELERLRPGMKLERLPLGDEATAPGSQRSYGVQALGKDRVMSFPPPVDPDADPSKIEELIGVWEVLSLDENGQPLLVRRDVWGRGEAPSR